MSESPPSSTEALLKTPLHSLHLELGARMVPFAGYQMPVQYPAGIKAEHQHCRSQAGLFDVSHMGQIVVTGANAAKELETLIPVDIEALATNQQSYGLLTHETGGIIDDLIITRWAQEQFFLVVNGACKHSDMAHIQSHLSAGVELAYLEDRALLALQGPAAKTVMADLCPDSTELTFMNGCRGSIESVEVYISRSGYTGEDGFEISVANSSAEKLARTLLSYDAVEALGLGARDSLRLEAGLCLYGHDMDIHTSPIEAALHWSISKSRRLGGHKEGGFLGAEFILEQMKDGAPIKRVGLDIEGRAPVREDAIIEDMDGNEIGVVTSGGFGPSIERPLAMGYVSADHAALGTKVNARVRGKARPATVCKMPFITPDYFRG